MAASRRQKTWQRAADEREFLVQGLAMIGGVIRWMQETCTVVVGDAVRAEVEDMMASWESNGATRSWHLRWTRTVRWAQKKILVNLSRAAVEKSPSWDPMSVLRREYEARLHDFYGLQGYWGES